MIAIAILTHFVTYKTDDISKSDSVLCTDRKFLTFRKFLKRLEYF